VSALAGVKSFGSSYAVGLVAALLALPGACSAAVVTWMLAGGGSTSAVLYGTVIGLGAWVAAGLFLRRLSMPQHANSALYHELANRHAKLKSVGATVESKSDRAAWAMYTTSLDSARKLLSSDDARDGFTWLRGTGYIAVFQEIHDAEQALTELVHEEEVVLQALSERAALEGSKVAEAKDASHRLERALMVLGAGDYLPDAPPAPNSTDKHMARAVVREVQATIDEFRDGRRASILRARNRLFSTMVFTGLVAYAGLVLAVLGGAEKTQIVAGATFYLIGATVGLFRQLQQAASADGVLEDDFGLGLVRLVHTPLVSGLAGVAGVILTAYLIELNDPNSVPKLADIFNVSESPLGLVTAAVFGFTPSLVGSALQKSADEAKKQLKSSAPGEDSD
jgi:hypothetical protein